MSSQQLRIMHKLWSSIINSEDKCDVLEMFSPMIKYNNEDISREEALVKLQLDGEEIKEFNHDLDILMIGEKEASIATRVTHRRKEAVGDEDQTEGWTDYTFGRLEDGKLTTLFLLREEGVPKKAELFFPTSGDIRMSSADMESMYRQYLDSINNQSLEDHLSKYCQPELTHNDRNLTISQYRGLIESSFDEIRGLKFELEVIIADVHSQRLAARIGFTGRAEKTFRGIEPTGKDVAFHEHVFYQLKDGKISTVWSTLDLVSYKNSIQ